MSDNVQKHFPRARLDEMRKLARSYMDGTLAAPKWKFDSSGHFDANESVFTARQLEYIRAGVYEVQYPELIGGSLVSANYEADPGAAIWTIQIQDQAGQVLVQTDMSGDCPMVDVKNSQQSTNFYSLRLGYQYSIQEARAAMMAKIPLPTRKAMACRGQLERKFDDILFVGDKTAGILGLLNQSSPATYTNPNGLAGSPTWALKTPDEILKDLNGAASLIVTNSKGVYAPDTTLLALASWELINATRVGDGTSMSILKYFMENNAHIRRVVGSFKGNTAGANSATRSVFYKNDAQVLECPTSVPFEQFAPQQVGMVIKTECHMRTAGVCVAEPLAVLYADNF